MMNDDDISFRTQIRNEVKHILNIGASQYKRVDSYRCSDGWVVVYYGYKPINIKLLQHELLVSSLAAKWDFDVSFIDNGEPKTAIKLTPFITPSQSSDMFSQIEAIKLTILSNIFKYQQDQNLSFQTVCDNLNLSKQDFIKLMDLSDHSLALDLMSAVAALNNKKITISIHFD